MVYNVRVINEQAAWLEAVLTNYEDLDTIAFLAEMPPDYVVPDAVHIPESQVNFVSRSENEVMIEVITDQAGLLVSSDLYSRDWQATIDGNVTNIYRANYAFRAVSVPAGKHTVQFVYKPLWFKFGRATTLGALVVIVFLFVFGKQTVRRK
jgi:uncharacterized membrane protein YfhO